MSTTTIQSRIESVFGVGSEMVHIAECESRLIHFDRFDHVLRGEVTPDDIGVFQINSRYHEDTAKRLGFDIYSLDGNIGYAKYLYDKNGTRDWNASKKCWSKKLVVS